MTNSLAAPARRLSAPLLERNLQRKLNLPRRPRRPADHPKPAPQHRVRRQPKIHNVEDIEKLGAELHDPPLSPAAPPKRRVLDQRDVELMESRPAKRVSPERPEPPLVRPRPARHPNGNREERRVVRAPPEIILANRPARRKIRHRLEIRPVRSPRPHPRLLNARIYRERRPARERRDVQKLPAVRHILPERLQESHFAQRQILDQT